MFVPNPGVDGSVDTSPEVVELSSLGAGCVADGTCQSGHCSGGRCCDTACDQPCAACGPTGHCDTTPLDDERCSTLSCPTDTTCRAFENLSAAARCEAFGACRVSASCQEHDAHLGTVCGDTKVCDAAGNCVLGVNGSACALDGDCQSGACVQGLCGVRTCAQLAAADLKPIEVANILQSSAPSENPQGGAILLSGDFTNVAHLCFDATELTQMFTNGFNVMIQMPIVATLGAHTIRAIRPDGHVSTAFPIHTVPAYSHSRLVTNSSGMVEPVIGAPKDIFTPTPKIEVDPITNQWDDVFGDHALVWQLGGEPWISSNIGGEVRSKTGQPGAYPVINGQYDLPHKRINLSLSPFDCTTGPPCLTWDYVGVFSCPKDTIVCPNFDPCHDTRDPNSPQSVRYWGSNYSREIVLFPVGPADPQGVLHFGADVCY